MSQREKQNDILAEFDKVATKYSELAKVATGILENILSDDGVQRQPIACRCKDRESLSRKLSKPGKNYESLSDITDIAGLRVVTYFAEDIRRVAAIVEAAFTIDKKNSVDKRVYKDPDRFGYKSLHYVVSFPNARCDLPDFSKYRGMKFEIQLRSILQHAWAEIEHKLGGYKSPWSVPREIRRRFSRIAGLLELADDEFSGIRKQLETYAADTERIIQIQPGEVGVDAISLKTLLTVPDSAAQQLAMAISSMFGRPLEEVDSARLDEIAYAASLLELRTIFDVEQVIAREHVTTLNFLHDQSRGAIAKPAVPPQWAIMYPLLIMLTRNPGKLYEYILRLGHFDPHQFIRVTTAQVERAAARGEH